MFRAEQQHFYVPRRGKICGTWTSRCVLCITINVPLFKKLRDIIFFCGTITFWAISRDILRGPRLFWPLKFRGQKSRGPLKMSREMAHKVIVPQKKIRSQSFLNSGTLVFLCTRVLLCTVVVCCCLLLGAVVCCCVLLHVREVGRSPCSYVVWAGIQGEGAGWQGYPSPSHNSVGIHGCLLVGGGVL